MDNVYLVRKTYPYPQPKHIPRSKNMAVSLIETYTQFGKRIRILMYGM